MIAAAGTGGHVFPGLAVGEALLHLGVHRDEIIYVGGDRLEAEVYPAEGFRFHRVELTGLKRSLTLANLRIPGVVMRAKRSITEVIDRSGARVVLGMGGYVTIPTGLAARSRRVPFFNAEQNASAGLANRVAARWARDSFVSFPETKGLSRGNWVGNPLREPFWSFDRAALRPEAMSRYELDGADSVLGVFGGSLGAGVLNEAVAGMVGGWAAGPLSLVHLTGPDHVGAMSSRPCPPGVVWRRVGFEDRMDLFYAAVDLVIARAGGAVAELTATATPSILVPGSFGSGGHQVENATFLERSGASRVLDEGSLGDLGSAVTATLGEPARLEAMSACASAISRPRAALTIGEAMIEAAR
ncbi:MAG: UDP-N-acetylglucosamine--N-acetylmuramyl-(pentapeptide) pyrophosphoryl-undecaprenol N-acetylglucosamine transferase [Acidimicrobiia bacterium]